MNPAAEWKGIPIPRVALWSTELLHEGRNEPLLKNRLALFSVAAPGGRPVLGIMSYERQRQAVLCHLCQVCGKPLGKWRFSPIIGRDIPLGKIPGGARWGDCLLRSEPMSCRPCAALAARICPALSRKSCDWEAVAETQVLLQVLRTDRFTEAEYRGPRGNPVVGYVEFLVVKVRQRWTWAEFLDETAGDVDQAAVLRIQSIHGAHLSAFAAPAKLGQPERNATAGTVPDEPKGEAPVNTPVTRHPGPPNSDGEGSPS